MKTLHELQNWITRVLDSRLNLNAKFLQSHQWTVVPVESGAHFDDSDVSRIALATREAGHDELNAILVEDIRNVNSNFRFNTDEDGIRHFNMKCGHFNYAICPNNCTFIIVCTTNDYYLLAGKQNFVESVLENSIVKSRREFDEFATDDEWPELERSVFCEVADRYR